MKKTVKFCLKVISGLSLLIFILVSALALRVLYAPVSVPYAAEMVESEAERLMPEWTVSFDTAEVGWGWSDVRPWVRVKNILVKDPAGKVEATVDDAWLSLSRADIFAAKFTIRAIKFDGLNLKIGSGGGNNFWPDLDPKRGPKAISPIIEDIFRHSEQLNKGMMRLSSASITNIKADIVDQDASLIVHLDIPNIDLDVKSQTLVLAINGSVDTGNDQIDLRIKADADIQGKSLSLDLDSDPVNLKRFVEPLNAPQYLSFLDAPLALALSLTATADEGLVASEMYLDVGSGYLSHSELFPIPARIEHLITEIEYSHERNSFLVTNISTDLKDHEIRGEALVYFEDGIAQPGVKADITLGSMTIPDLKVYWPNFGRGTAKKWVETYMTTGSMSNAHFVVDVGTDGVGAYRDGSIFDLTFKYHGLDAVYIKTMPTMTNIDGSGHYTRTKIDLTIDSSKVDGLTLGTSHLTIHDLHIRGQAYAIADIHIAAPVQDLLHLTAFPPINLNERMKIGPERIKGFAITDTNIRFPVRKGIKPQDVEFKSRVQGSDVEIHDLMKGEGIRNATIDLTVTNNGLEAEGDIDLNGVSMHASWAEDFLKGKIEEADTTQFTLSGNFDAEDIKAFNIDISSFLDGKVPAEATFTGRKFNIREGHFTVDATSSIINVSQMAWQKIAGRPAIISGSIKFSPDEVTLSPLMAQGPGIDFRGDFHWNMGDKLRFTAELNAEKMDANSFTASIERVGTGAYYATIKAKEIDVRPFLEFQEQEKKNVTSVLEKSTVHISVHADKAHFMNGIKGTDMVLESTFTEDGPQESKGKVFFESGKAVDLAIFVEDNATRSLWIETEDAGALLSGMGLFAHGKGGKITYDGQMEQWGRSLELNGEAVGKDMKVVPVAMLSEETKIGLISGIDEIVGNKGTDFDTLVIPFSYDKGLLDMNGLRASGGSIGLTLEGQIDVFENKINMNGVYVPVYGLNSVIGNIPLIGPILTGGKGQGVFGVAYRVKGMLDAPNVTINPLSGIAPGIFRRIFEGRKGKVSDVKDEKPKEKPEETPPPIDGGEVEVAVEGR